MVFPYSALVFYESDVTEILSHVTPTLPSKYMPWTTGWLAHGPDFKFLQALELAVQTNPNSSTNGDLSVWCAFTGQTERAMALFERARQLNPHISGWYYYTSFFTHACRAEYEQALAAAQQVRMPAGNVGI